jgi:hypothetical protein
VTTGRSEDAILGAIVRVASATVRVASLEDIIAAKRAAGRPKDLAALPILEQTLRVRSARANSTKKK